MAEFDSMEYGFNSTNVADLLDKLSATSDSGIMGQAIAAVQDYSAITTACMQHWAGKSKDKFLENIKTDADIVVEKLSQIYGILDSEIKALQAAMVKKDEDLIPVDE